MSAYKNCINCANRRGLTTIGTCVAAGIPMMEERRENRRCSSSFGAWQPRDGILARIYRWLTGEVIT